MYRIIGPAMCILVGCGSFQSSSSWTFGGHGSSTSTMGSSQGNGTNTVSNGGGGKAFDVNRDCTADAGGSGGRLDYHRDPILFWPCFEGGQPGTAEYSTFAHNCDDTNKTLGSSLACRIDHRGFDEHYRLEAAKSKQLNRESRDPGDYCESVFQVFQARVVAPSTLGDIATHPKIKQEFLSKVKTLVCAYDDERAAQIELSNGNLMFYVKASDNAPRTDWIDRGIQRLFPEYAKWHAERFGHEAIVGTEQRTNAQGRLFDYNDDCFAKNDVGGRVDYHRDPVLFWPCFEGGEEGTPEYTSLAHNCDDINKALGGTSIRCVIDHPSFDAHFGLEAKKPKRRDRDTRDPGGYCEQAFSVFQGRTAMSPPVFNDIATHPQIKQEFLRKVKTLACVYDENLAQQVRLKNGTLTFYVKAEHEAGEPRLDWIARGIRPLLREYTRWHEEND
jgi:hypothetical protein